MQLDRAWVDRLEVVRRDRVRNDLLIVRAQSALELAEEHLEALRVGAEHELRER